jgi:hypothetical protein
MTDLKLLLLEAPESQMDSAIKPLIAKWDEPSATPLQVLEVLDQVIYSSLGSDFVVAVLQSIYAGRLEQEGITHEEVVKLATWRNT